MREINWDAPLSDDDKAWLRQRGTADTEAQIEANEAKFSEEEDANTGDQPDDDYESWKANELKDEAEKRKIDITGMKKPDVIAALRTWDATNE